MTIILLFDNDQSIPAYQVTHRRFQTPDGFTTVELNEGVVPKHGYTYTEAQFKIV